MSTPADNNSNVVIVSADNNTAAAAAAVAAAAVAAEYVNNSNHNIGSNTNSSSSSSSNTNSSNSNRMSTVPLDDNDNDNDVDADNSAPDHEAVMTTTTVVVPVVPAQRPAVPAAAATATATATGNVDNKDDDDDDNDNNDNDNSNDNNVSVEQQHRLWEEMTRSSKMATMSNPWQYDDMQSRCANAQNQQCRAPNPNFDIFNRRHHCRLCGKIYCGLCSTNRSLIPPTSIVLVPRGGKKVKPSDIRNNGGGMDGLGTISFAQQDDPDRMLTYTRNNNSNSNSGSISSGNASYSSNGLGNTNTTELLYGKGLEERFTLAREPLRVCDACHHRLQPLQQELRGCNSNAVRFNHVDPTDPRRLFNSPLAFTLGHEIRKAAFTLNNLLPLPKRTGALLSFTDHRSGGSGSGSGSSHNPYGHTQVPFQDKTEMQHCKDSCSGISVQLGDLDGVRIPAKLLDKAKGVACLTVAKGGFGLAGVEFGTGLVVARIDGSNSNRGGGSWSAPAAIGMGGLSWGALLGMQLTDHVFLLMTDDAVDMMFCNDGSVQLGADIGVAVGPVGRAAEADWGVAATPSSSSNNNNNRNGNNNNNNNSIDAKAAPIYTYSFSKGLYAGVSLAGKVVRSRDVVNENFYGRRVTAQDILRGNAVPVPPAAQPLYEALTRCHVYASSVETRRANAAAATSSNNNPNYHHLQPHPSLPPVLDAPPEETYPPAPQTTQQQQQHFSSSLQYRQPLYPTTPVESANRISNMMNNMSVSESDHPSSPTTTTTTTSSLPPPGPTHDMPVVATTPTPTIVALPPEQPPPVPPTTTTTQPPAVPTIVALPPEGKGSSSSAAVSVVVPESAHNEDATTAAPMPPATAEEHSFAGLSAITSDPGY